MDLTLHPPDQRYYIHSVSQQGIVVNDQRHQTGLIIGPEHLTVWPAEDIDHLTEETVEAWLELNPELLLLGTGATHRFPEPARLMPLMQTGIGVEIMTTDAACRTFNLLLGEGRRVVAALLPIRGD